MAISIRKLLTGAAFAVLSAIGAFVIFEHIPEVNPIPANGPIDALPLVDSKFLAISEAFSSVLTIQISGEVTGVHGVNNINESAGLTIRVGQVVLMGDAESYLPDPPLYLIGNSNQF